MERTILHVDCNKFYASVECKEHPELAGKPVAVGGDVQMRHGIILTKNEIASRYGITVGEALWQARQKCPELVVVPPNFPLYLQYSKRARKIYEDYSDFIEPFGLDECWLDVSGDARSGEEIAHEIRRRVKTELGITVSVGVSFNKIFAKLGSDYKKPDAVTVISRDNFREIAWCLPCSDLLFVGRSTTKKLHFYGIHTIGDLACADAEFLKNIFGKNGIMLHQYANGNENAPVRHKDAIRDVKSVGNSTTTARDMTNNAEVKLVMRSLCDSVSERLKAQQLKGKTVTIYVRDAGLSSFTRQQKMKVPTDLSVEILDGAMTLFQNNYIWNQNVRSLGVAVSDFDEEICAQFDLDGTVEKREKLQKIENAMYRINCRYGKHSIQRACQLRASGWVDIYTKEEPVTPFQR